VIVVLAVGIVAIIVGIVLCCFYCCCKRNPLPPAETTPNAQRFDLEENRQRDLVNASATQHAGGTVVVAAEVVFTVSNNETRIDDSVVKGNAIVAASPP